MRRLPTSITTSTYTTRNIAVTAVKKSQATRTRAWFLTKVAQRWSPRPAGRPCGQYRRTVRGDTRTRELHQQLRRHPLLAPAGIGGHHLGDQPAQLSGYARSSRGPGSQPPQQPKSLPLPADQRLGPHYDQRPAPAGRPARQPRQVQPLGRGQPSWPGAAFDKQRQLPAQ